MNFAFAGIVFPKAQVVFEASTYPPFTVQTAKHVPTVIPSRENIEQATAKEALHSLVWTYPNQLSAANRPAHKKGCNVVETDALLREKVPESAVLRDNCK